MCCQSDTLGWLAAQLDGPGDAVIAALTIADQFLLTLPVAKEEGRPGVGRSVLSTRYPAIGNHADDPGCYTAARDAP